MADQETEGQDAQKTVKSLKPEKKAADGTPATDAGTPDFEKQIADLRAEFDGQIEALKRDHAKQVDELTQGHNAEINSLRDQNYQHMEQETAKSRKLQSDLDAANQHIASLKTVADAATASVLPAAPVEAPKVSQHDQLTKQYGPGYVIAVHANGNETVFTKGTWNAIKPGKDGTRNGWKASATTLENQPEVQATKNQAK